MIKNKNSLVVHHETGIPDIAATAPDAAARTPSPILFASVTGTSGNDFIHVSGDGLVAPGAYNDLATATAGDDTIDVSQAGTDQVYAGGGNDDIKANAGDTVDGGTGINRLTLDLTALSAGQTFTFDSHAATATTLADGTGFKNIQKFILTTGAGNDTVTFKDPVGFTDENHFAVFDTPDSWDGGGGVNRAVVDLSDIRNGLRASYSSQNSVDTWNIDLSGGGTAYLQLSHVQSIDITTGSGADVITGGPGSDRIDAGGGNDRIDGGTGGPDTIIAGSGNDNITYAAPGSSVDGGTGTDAFTDDLSAYNTPVTLIFNPGGTYTLADGTTIGNIEILNLTTGSGNDNITFKDNNYVLTGPVLTSWDGGGGTDTVTLDYSATTTPVSMYQPGLNWVQVYSVGGGLLEGFIRVENFNVTGTSGNDYLTGSVGHNVIDGGGGFDTLVFSGNRADYSIVYDAGTGAYTVIDQRDGTPNGTTIGTHIAQLSFANGIETFDTANTMPWATQFVSRDGMGDVQSVSIVTDGGTAWVNSFGTDSGYTWQTRTASYDAQGHQLTLEVNNVDGTHALTLYDAANQYAWAQATISYDSSWNITGVTGTNDDASHTIAMRDIAAALDTALWYTKPYDANNGQPVALNLSGGQGYNYLYGGAGDDTLAGNGQFSLLDGGHGNDTLSGTSNTRFVFHNGDGVDTITWFLGSTFHDVIELHGYGVADFAQLQPYLSQVGSDVLIAFDPNNQITLGSITLGQLQASDFLFS